MSLPRRRSTTHTLVLIFAILAAVVNVATAQSPHEVEVALQGHRVRAVITGTGSPPVVFEAGMGETLQTWSAVQPAIAKLTTTFAYDRPGLGESEPSPRARDARTMADELRDALHAAGIAGPYLLVGHSLGAWIVTVFAHVYPDQVLGLVLVDPAYQESRLRAVASAEDWNAREKVLAGYANRMSVSQRREREALNTSGDQALASFPLPLVPTVLLSGTETNVGFPASALERDVKLTVHREWIVRIPGTEHILVEQSRHYIQQDAPAEVIAAIERVLEKARTANRLQ